MNRRNAIRVLLGVISIPVSAEVCAAVKSQTAPILAADLPKPHSTLKSDIRFDVAPWPATDEEVRSAREYFAQCRNTMFQTEGMPPGYIADAVRNKFC